MKFGIIGTNWITDKFIDAGNQIKDFEIAAVYSRTAERAKEFSKKYKIKKIFTNLEEMAESDDIDGVYIASPNCFHAEQSILFLKNKKAVLCEKPSVSNSIELKKVIQIAKENETLYMEAMKTTFIPTYNVLKENLYKIGKVRQILSGYCKFSSAYEDYLNGDIKNSFRPEFSNGALMDIGVYPIFFIISLFGIPNEIKSQGKILDNGKGIDVYGNLNMIYEDKNAIVMFSKVYSSYLPTEIVGESGAFLIEHISEMDKLYYIDRKNNGDKIDLTIKRKENGMYYELKHFIELFKEGKKESPINSFDLSLKVMKIIDETRDQIGIVFPADKLKNNY